MGREKGIKLISSSCEKLGVSTGIGLLISRLRGAEDIYDESAKECLASDLDLYLSMSRSSRQF